MVAPTWIGSDESLQPSRTEKALTVTIYFTDKSFKFLRALARNNEREWFHAHKAEYDAHVRAPFQALLTGPAA